MSILVWVMMAIAIWHFAVFVPDRFRGGIVGAFLSAIAGALVVGLVLNGFEGGSIGDTSIWTAVEAVPGAVAGLAAAYVAGVRAEREL